MSGAEAGDCTVIVDTCKVASVACVVKGTSEDFICHVPFDTVIVKCEVNTSIDSECSVLSNEVVGTFAGDDGSFVFDHNCYSRGLPPTNLTSIVD